MKRILWIGVAVLVAAVVAVPLWLVLDDDGARRAGALVTPTAAGDVGRLTLIGPQSGTVVVQVRSFDVEVKSPRDAATGQASGKVLYMPLKVLKAIDAKSPTLLKMLVSHESLSSANLELTVPAGVESKPGTYMTYEFANPKLIEWRDGTAETIALTHTGVTSKPGPAKPPASTEAAVGQMTYQGTVVPITAFETGVESPVDAATGLASGKRRHSTVTVVRPLDGIAHTVMANVKSNILLGQVKIELLGPIDGKLGTYATYTYGNAAAAAVDDAGAAGRGASQRFEFTYGTIEVSAGGVVATDSWYTPVS
jgi:type VI protein secretion system component Hcp